MIILIAAVDENNGIGLNGSIPWYIPSELKHFKDTTMGKTIAMGGNTFRSLGKPLSGRKNIVLSRKMNNADGAMVFSQIEEMITYLLSLNEDVFIIGGEEMYREFLSRDLVDNLIISHVSGTHNCDTFLPPFDFSKFKLEHDLLLPSFMIETFRRV